MTGLGESLREARKRKGYTLDDLQEITKIQKRYLAGIENEEYDAMPGSFYIRAFIKQYAEAVDLDADEMLNLYKGSAGKTEKIEEEQQMAAPTLTRRQSRHSGRLNEVMPKIIVALFVVVIILVLTFLYRHSVANKSDLPVGSEDPVQMEDQGQSKDKGNVDNSTDVETDDEKPTSDDESDGRDDEADETQKEQTLEHVEMNGADSMYRLENTDTLKLEIRTNDESWIGVLDENQNELSPEARTMHAGEKLEIDASDAEKVRIRVGRTSATEIYVNGELLEYASDAITQNIHIEFQKG